ncbi:hypothetical protein scyTo_0005233 [Scyliorhinus torazame]|uniref:EGF-like domain-containing protein n=1 Tax=Scyliorhinus torazame TaxID=75743 RepID=A0A401P4C9_SCYTO|nr:hypothetical protein [Scyliorhinus torazame]
METVMEMYSYGVCFNGGKCIEGMSQLCHCPEGFQGPRCQYDVNECGNDNGGCEGQCCNTIGNFYCKCQEGLKLMADGKTCEGRGCGTAGIGTFE